MKLENLLENWHGYDRGQIVSCFRCNMAFRVDDHTMAIVKAGTPGPACDWCTHCIELKSGGRTAGGHLVNYE